MCSCYGTFRCGSCKSHDLAPWEKEILTGVREGEGDVIFTLVNGDMFTINRVRVDSVGPSATGSGVIGVEFFDSDRVVHVPFVRSWEFDYPGQIVRM